MSRLKHLQKVGLMPLLNRPGRGRANTYSFSELAQLAIGVSLLNCGVQPQKAAVTVASSWGLLRNGVGWSITDPGEVKSRNEAVMAEGREPIAEDVWWIVRSTGLTDLQGGRYDYLPESLSIMQLHGGRLASLSALSAKRSASDSSWALIAASALMKSITDEAGKRYKDGTLEHFRSDIDEEMSRDTADAIKLFAQDDSEPALSLDNATRLLKHLEPIIQNTKSEISVDFSAEEVAQAQFLRKMMVSPLSILALSEIARGNDPPPTDVLLSVLYEMSGYRLLAFIETDPDQPLQWFLTRAGQCFVDLIAEEVANTRSA